MRYISKTFRFAQISIVLAVALAGCYSNNEPRKKTETIYVTLPPIAYLVREIAGPGYKVKTLFSDNQNPHTFEPQIKQIKEISQSDIFFVAGLPEEQAFEKHFKGKKYPVVMNVSENITKMHMGCSKCAGCSGLDPHTWMTPDNLSKQAVVIFSALVMTYPEDKRTFKIRLDTLMKKLDALDKSVRAKLAPCKGDTFFVYHPSFGYFAKQYNLKQIAIEKDGKKPSIKHLEDVIKIGQKLKNKVVIAQPQFLKKYPEMIAREIGAKVYAVNPLGEDPTETISKLADIIAGSYSEN